MARISGKPLAVSGDVTVDSPTFHIDSDNDLVGIGTTSPSTALHVKSETGDTAIKIQAGSESDDDGAAQVTFSDYQRTASIGLMSTDIVIAKDSSIDPLSDDRRVTIDVDNGNVGVGHKFGQHRRPEGSSSASVLTVENTTTSGSAQGGNLRLGSNDGAVMASGHRLGVIEFAGSEAASPGPSGRHEYSQPHPTSWGVSSSSWFLDSQQPRGIYYSRKYSPYGIIFWLVRTRRLESNNRFGSRKERWGTQRRRSR